MTSAEAQRMAAQAFSAGADMARKIEAFNPFARSHHSDITSSSTGTGSASSTRSPRAAARATKEAVAAFYGLQDPQGDNNYLLDMLGTRRLFSEVTLAHLFPRSYENFHEFASFLSLPRDFNTNPRNFLLIDRELHTAFDDGLVGFIPKNGDFPIIRVFQLSRVSRRVADLDGQRLRWPKEAAKPYYRILGWFAWLAKGALRVPAAIQEELETSLGASDDSAGARALHSAVKDAVAANKVVRSLLVL